MKVYISGAISGLQTEEVKLKFETAERLLAEAGHEPVNPYKEVPYEEGKQWHEYMGDDVKLLLQCEAIYMLDDWINSRGAVLEHCIAQCEGFKIVYKEDGEVDFDE